MKRLFLAIFSKRTAKAYTTSAEMLSSSQLVCSRYSTSEDLARIVDLLRRWEMQFHNEVGVEVLKCWRLQVGSNLVTNY